MSAITYTVRRECNPGSYPTEYETREGWSGLTAKQVTAFLTEVRDWASWRYCKVQVVSTDGQEWSWSDWLYQMA